MRKTAHILNGDSTASIMHKSNLSGTFIVWRELLCEGPLLKSIGSDDFWKIRYAFFEDQLDISKLNYYDKTIQEIIKIEDTSRFDKIVLWFEYDLFCQVNLIALCAYLLNHYRKDITYSLVCVGKEDNKEMLQTLSDYSPEDYEQLYEERVKLTRHDLVFATACWEQSVHNDVQELKTFDFAKNLKFKYLQKAMNQHLKRFKDDVGLNQIDYKILNTIKHNKFTKRDILRELLIWQKKETVYGFGDIQYVNYLEKLRHLYSIKNKYHYLNDHGKLLLKTA